MGVPMRMRCDNCGYDYVGQLHYSDQRRGDVIRCKACEYEVPVLSDEEIAAVESTLNKERNMGIYAMVAWAAFFTAMVVLGISYFWQVGAGLGDDKGAKNEEILWQQDSRTALFLKANVTGNDKHAVTNTALIANLEANDGTESQVVAYNNQLKKMYDKVSNIGASIDSTLIHNAAFDNQGKLAQANTFDQEYGQFISGARQNEAAIEPSGWGEPVVDLESNRKYFANTTPKDVTIKAELPDGGSEDLAMKLFVTIESRPVQPSGNDKPLNLAAAELQYNQGDITLAIDPFSKQVIRTEIKRPATTDKPELANAVVFGKALVVTAPIQLASFKAAKDTAPTSVQLLMMVLAFLAFPIALAFTWLGNKARYTMQLGLVEEPEEPAALEGGTGDEDGDIGGGDIEAGKAGKAGNQENQATAKFNDDYEIS